MLLLLFVSDINIAPTSPAQLTQKLSIRFFRSNAEGMMGAGAHCTQVEQREATQEGHKGKHKQLHAVGPGPDFPGKCLGPRWAYGLEQKYNLVSVCLTI